MFQCDSQFSQNRHFFLDAIWTPTLEAYKIQTVPAVKKFGRTFHRQCVLSHLLVFEAVTINALRVSKIQKLDRFRNANCGLTVGFRSEISVGDL